MKEGNDVNREAYIMDGRYSHGVKLDDSIRSWTRSESREEGRECKRIDMECGAKRDDVY